LNQVVLACVRAAKRALRVRDPLNDGGAAGRRLRRFAGRRHVGDLNGPATSRGRRNPLEMVADPAEGPPDQAMRRELSEKIRETLVSVDPTQIAVLRVWLWQGLSGSRAAAALGFGGRQQFHRAVAALRPAFDPPIGR
jgi:DNA-directed RNA polymerase specialized sigma24 family protein